MLLGLGSEIKKPKQPEYQARSRPPAWPSPRVPPPPGLSSSIVFRALLPAARWEGGHPGFAAMSSGAGFPGKRSLPGEETGRARKFSMIWLQAMLL